MSRYRGIGSVVTLKDNRLRNARRRRDERLRSLQLAPRELRFEPLEVRQMLTVGPELIAVVPNQGQILRDGDIRDLAPQELTFRFDNNQVIAATTLDAIRIERSGHDGIFGNGNDVLVTPGFAGIADQPNQVIVRFADTLPDDRYRITIQGAGLMPLTNDRGDRFNDGTNETLEFTLNLGPQVVAVVPQPIGRETNGLMQTRDTIQVYFNKDPLDAAVALNTQLYQLLATQQTAETDDDEVFYPETVSYDADAGRVVLDFADNLEDLGTTASGTFRLRVGNDYQGIETAILATESDAGSSFVTAGTELGTLGTSSAQSFVITGGSIEPTQYDSDFLLEWPGGVDELGHRQLPNIGEDSSEDHFINNGVFPDVTYEDPLMPGLEPEDQLPTPWDKVPGITDFEYNFQDEYGEDPFGNVLHNLITDVQKQRAREVFDIIGDSLGVQFTETPDSGITVATGDVRAAEAEPGMVPGVALFDPFEFGMEALVVMSASVDWGTSPLGGEWFTVAMHEVQHTLGFGHTYDLPPLTIMGSSADEEFGIGSSEAVFPGDHDIVHGQHMYRPDSNDIDLYKFTLETDGLFSAETMAERLSSPSPLDTALTLFEEVEVEDEHGLLLKRWRTISRNDDYFSEDSYQEVELGAGTYYIGVTSAGNIQYDPRIENSGIGGTTQGSYELRVNFVPEVTDHLIDATGTLFDGDADGVAGGVYNFWFNSRSESDTMFVDKLADGSTADGSLANPYSTISAALAAAESGDIVRIIGNHIDNDDPSDPLTLQDNQAYEIGRDVFNAPLADGSKMEVPQGVTVMIDAGAVFKLREANIDVGSSAQGIDRSLGAVQVLGTPEHAVHFTSFHNEEIGTDGEPLRTTIPEKADWGGLVFRNDLDFDAGRTVLESAGIFLNYVNHASLSYGGGEVNVNSIRDVFTPVHMVEARPTISHNTITQNADGAISADPNSFADTKFQTNEYTADYERVGPDFYGNRLIGNTLNGVFVRVRTDAGRPLDELEVTARFDDNDVVHVISENLVLSGDPGGLIMDPTLAARLDARLAIDPGVVVKFDGARIEAEVGTQLIAEGTVSHPVTFTSLPDQRYGAGGTFVTAENLAGNGPAAGNWGGLYFAPISTASIDHALIAYAGGTTTIEGGFARFNPIEIHQADARITNTLFEDNSDGGGGDRNGRLPTVSSTVFVRGAQPIVAQNRFRRNVGPVISIDANAMRSAPNPDWGRATGDVSTFQRYADNRGPLLRENRIEDNDLNGVEVRGGTLTTETVWDDADIVHVLRDEIIVPNHHTFSGLRLQSSPTESLVVKLSGSTAGFTASGSPQEIDDRIGGTVQIVGAPGHPVVLTSLADDTFGAGLDSQGHPQRDTNNDGFSDDLDRFARGAQPAPGDWRSVLLDRYSNDRNVGIVNELEPSFGTTMDLNADPFGSQFLGDLAPEEKAADDNLRLGFQVNGQIRFDDPADSDVYSFRAEAGTEVWFDIDRSTHALDTVVELIDADGIILATSDDSLVEQNGDSAPSGIGLTMDRDVWLTKDIGTTNARDAGMRVALPGPAGKTRTYYVRVRSTLAIGHLDAAQLVEQQLFHIRDGNGPITFELDSGPELRLDAAGPQAVRDGETIVLSDGTDSRTLEFNSGSVLIVGDGMTLVGGDQFLVDDMSFANAPVVFEFVDTGQGGAASEGVVPIEFMGTESADEVIDLIVDAINGVESLGVTAAGYSPDGVAARISLENDQLISTIVTSLSPTGDNNDLLLSAVAPDPTLENVDIVFVNSLASGDEAFVSFEATETILTIDVDPAATTAATVLMAINDEETLFAALNTAIEMENDGSGLIADTGILGTTVRAAGVELDGDYGLSDPSHVQVRFEETASAEDLLSDIAVVANSEFQTLTAGAGPVNEIDELDEPTTGTRLTLHGVTSLDLSGTPALSQVPGTGTGVADSHVAVVFTAADTPEDIAEAISSAIEQAQVDFGFQVFPRILGASVVLDAQDVDLSIGDSPFIAVGPTQGAYQLHLRLRELQEYAGSAVRQASIHYATNGIEMFGLPTHSPLVGEVAEVETGNTFEDAQDIGNLLDSDLAALQIAGFLGGAGDVDWYQFAVDVAKLGPLSKGGGTWPVMFDIDYADGMERPDLAIWLFDSAGNLIYAGQDSNVVDDRPGPLEGADFDNLERGTVGALDPFIGTIQLLEGATYFVAVTGQDQVPTALSQSTLRQEPIDSLFRIVEDHIGDQDLSLIDGRPVLDADSEFPYSTPLFPDLDLHADAFHLGDVVTYIITGGDLFTVDPFTGAMETDVTADGTLPGVDDGTYIYGDVAMRSDGQLYTFTATTPNAGIYARLDTGDATTFLSETPDGITTYVVGEMTIDENPDGSVNFNAMVHEEGTTPDSRRVLAVGNSPDFENLLYLFDSTGVAIDHPDNDGRNRVPTNIIPLAQLFTDGKGPGGLVTGMAFVSGTLYAVSDSGGFYEVEDPFTPGLDPDPAIDEDPSLADTILPNGGGPMLKFITTVENDGQPIAFSGLARGPQNVEGARFAEMLFATDADGIVYAIDTEGTLQPIFLDGSTSVETGVAGATGIDFSPIDFNLWHTTDLRGDDAGHGVETAPDGSRTPPDFPVPGGTSFYFGFEDPTAATNPQPGADNYVETNPDVLNTFDMPGGAHGSVTTAPFSLVGYDAADAPTLYFSYFLDRGDSPVHDTARVFISSDGGAEWTQLGSDLADSADEWRQTRIDIRDFAGLDNLKLRFDFATAGDMHVGDELNEAALDAFMYTGAILRAIPSSELNDGDVFFIGGELIDDEVVGGDQFEFDLGHELLIPNTAGATIEDDPDSGGESFTIEDQMGQTVIFEFDKDGILVTGDVAISIQNLDTTFDVAAAVNQAIGTSGLTGVSSFVNGAEINVLGAAGMTVSSGATVVLRGANGVDLASTPVPVGPNFTADQVAEVIAAAVDQFYSGLREFRTVDGATLDIAKPFVAALDMTIEMPNDGTGLVTNTGNVGTMTLVGTGAAVASTGANNDFTILSSTPLHGIDVIFINDTAAGDMAVVTFDGDACTLTIDVDPTATSASTIVDEINAEGTFMAMLDASQELANDGSGLIVDIDTLATTGDVFAASVTLDGDNNDFTVTSGTLIDPRFEGLEMVVINEDAEGDEALVGYYPAAGMLTIDVDPTATTTNTVIAGIIAIGSSFSVSDGNAVFSFELENLANADGIGVGNIPVLYDTAFSAEEVALAVVEAFNAENSAVAAITVVGDNNDILIRSAMPGLDFEDIEVVYVNDTAVGDQAIVTFDQDAGTLTIDIDPLATTANTVVTEINAEGSFVAELDLTEAPTNDGTGLIISSGTAAVTAEVAGAIVTLTELNNDFRVTAKELDPQLVGIEIVFVNDTASGDEALVTLDAVGGTLTIDVDPTATMATTVVAAINDEGTFAAELDLTADATNDGSGLVVDVGPLALTELFANGSVLLAGANNDFLITAVLPDPALIGLEVVLTGAAGAGDQASITLDAVGGTLTIEYDPTATTANTVVEAIMGEGTFLASLNDTLHLNNDGTGLIAPLGVVGITAVPDYNNITVVADVDLVIFEGPVVLLDVGSSAFVPVGSVDLPDVLTSIKLDGSLLHVIGHTVTDARMLSYFNELPGDHPDPPPATDQFLEDPPPATDQFLDFARGQDNLHEGFYFDSVIIGFSERGEMITGQSTDTSFTSVSANGAILTGPYQLEIRGGTEIGNPLYRAYDTNDRHNQGITLLALEPGDIFHGRSFSVTDGVSTASFELVSAALGPTGNGVPISFTGSETAGEMGDLIASAINALEDIGISASSVPSSNRVDLLGAAGAIGIDFIVFGDVANISGQQGSALFPQGPVKLTGIATDGNSLRDEILGEGIMTTGDATLIGGPVSAGFWTDGVNSGIVLTTGDANFIEGPNRDDSSTGFASEEGDADLDAEFGFDPLDPFASVTRDTTSLEFQFESVGGDLFFEFAFASEEYNEFTNAPFNDVFGFFLDGVNIALIPGTATPVAINNVNGGNPLGTDASNPELYNNNDPDDEGEFLELIGYDGFTDVFTAQTIGLDPGMHTIKLVVSDVSDTILDSGVFIKSGTFSDERPDTAAPSFDVTLISSDKTDTNHFRGQGQTIIESNTIFHSAEFAIRFDAGERDSSANWPHPGSVVPLREINTQRLLPSVSIVNNLIAYGEQGGMFFSGDANLAGTPVAAVPFGRIVNNTVFGFADSSSGVGIMVTENASPTILNNIVAGLATGIEVDGSSSSTVIGATVYQNNFLNKLALGGAFEATEIFLAPNSPLFANSLIGNFYLAAGSRAIDSSLNALSDRPALTTVRAPLGIPPSPILAPDRDLQGQLRRDDPDVAPPPGFGQKVFKNRGALDGDRNGPSAQLIVPLDNDAVGFDLDPNPNAVLTAGQIVTEFAIQLSDIGIGIDDSSVAAKAVTLFRDGVELIEAGDTSTDPAEYAFSYDATNDVIHLTALAGVWTVGNYRIELDNSESDDLMPIQDLATNPLVPNQLVGMVEFTIQIVGPAPDFGDAPSDFGDAPDPPFATLLPTGASHNIVEGFFLGFGVDADGNGDPSADADRDAFDDGVQFDTSLRVGREAQITVRASMGGRLDGWIGGAQIFASELLLEGLNTITFTVPSGIGAVGSESYARFRLSSGGGLGPGGRASDGEVEDYLVQIETPPWQNPDNRFDVNNNGVVSSQDILLLSNFFFFNGQLPVPDGPGTPPFPVAPPPFYDVNGDDAVTVADGLLLATFLRTALAIEAVDGVMDEGNTGSSPPTSFTFIVTRAGDVSRTTSVNYTVTRIGADSADAADFVGGFFPSGTVVFDPLDEMKTITIVVVGDANIEPDEDFAVTLSNAVISQITTPTAIATIVDDDAGTAGDGANNATPPTQAALSGVGDVGAPSIGETMPPTVVLHSRGEPDNSPLVTLSSRRIVAKSGAARANFVARRGAVDHVMAGHVLDDPSELVGFCSPVRCRRQGGSETVDEFFAKFARIDE